MQAAPLLRHEHRHLEATRRCRGHALSKTARLSLPTVRHLQRTVGSTEAPVEVAASEDVAPSSWKIVARMWVGVIAMFTLVIVVGLATITLLAWAVGYRPVVVSSGSMNPLIRTGDVVITRKVDSAKRLGVQTVVDFEDPATDERRLHRIIESNKQGYRTKGDANADADSTLIPRANIHGAGVVLAPFVGYMPLWASQGAWGKLAGLGVALVLLGFLSRRSWMWAQGKPR